MLQNHNVAITNKSARHGITDDAQAESVARRLKPDGGNIDDDAAIWLLAFVVGKSGRNGAEQRNLGSERAAHPGKHFGQL